MTLSQKKNLMTATSNKILTAEKIVLTVFKVLKGKKKEKTRPRILHAVKYLSIMETQ